jgi:RNA polymerase sigma-70 factor (ECF subfamily)
VARMEPEVKLELLVHEHFGRVAAYLLSRTNAESAGEALAKVLEVAWRRLDDVPSEPLPWLLGVARRVLADEWRTQGRQQALIARLAESEAVRQRSFGSGGETDADTTIDRLVAIEALAALSESDREALLLVAWDGLTTRQGAAVLGCSRGTFAVRLFRARSRLNGHLATSALSDSSPSAQREPEISGSSPNQVTSETQES